jgi:DNA mismatch repair protein MutS2
VEEVFSHSERVLELGQVLEAVAQKCQTGLGVAAIRARRPSFQKEVLLHRLKETEEARALWEQGKVPDYATARDVRSCVEVAGKGATLSGGEIYRIGETLGAMARLRAFFVTRKEAFPTLWSSVKTIPYLPELQRIIEQSVAPNGSVRDEASGELKSLRAKIKHQHQKILQKLQSLVHGSLREFLQEPTFTQREGRYVVPVKGSFKNRVLGIVHDVSTSGQTVYIEPQALVEDGNHLREWMAREAEEVERILSSLSREIGAHAEEIQVGLETLAHLDAVLAMGRYAMERSASSPVIREGRFLRVEKGHHPLIPLETSVPLTVSLTDRRPCLLITGPNTGGKTVTLKLLGLYVLMMHCGIFPPAEKVEYGPFLGVWADIGDEQSVELSLSTFSAHLRNIVQALRGCEEGHLVLLDEIGAGTDPREGAALGIALLEAFIEKGAIVAATTHFGEIKRYAQSSDRFMVAGMEFDRETLRPTFVLIMGASGASHALEISERLGIPQEVIRRAERELGEEAIAERERSQALDNLLREAQALKAEAEKQRKELEDERRRLAQEREELRAKFQKMREKMEQRLEDGIKEAREQYRSLLNELKSLRGEAPSSAGEKGLSGKAREALLQRAREVEESLTQAREEIEEMIQETPFGGEAPSPPSEEERPPLAPGMWVSLRSHGRKGQVVEVRKDGKVVVLMGRMKLTVDPGDVRVLPHGDSPEFLEAHHGRASELSLKKRAQVPTEINLRLLPAEEAKARLEKYLDDVKLAGLPSAKIIHGKGEGILKRLTREVLSSRTDVVHIREGYPGEGGSGVTVVYFA